jgi:hypothetical protein
MKHQLASDFKYTDFFNTFRLGMVEDFLKVFPNFSDKQPTPEERELDPKYKMKTVGQWKTAGNAAAGDAWKVEGLRYTDPDVNTRSATNRDKYPSAWRLVEFFDNVFPDGVEGGQIACPIATYSIMEAHSRIGRHTGIENRRKQYVRCHIPLIVPEGDIKFEIERSIIIDWSDVFAFDNQCEHSAWNNSSYRRLVFLIDLHRSVVGWPAYES